MPVGKITNKSELVTWIDENKTRERRRNQSIMAEWVNILAAFHNRTDLQIGSDFREIQRLTPAQRKDLEEIAVNWVQPHIRTAAAHLQKSRPMLNVVPVTTDEQDLEAAKVGDRLLRAEWEEQQMPLHRIEKAIWMIATGTGIWHTYFDKNKGEVNNGVNVGKIITESVNPFKIVFEPNRVDHTECRWAIMTQRLPVDEIEHKYKESFARLNNGDELKIAGKREENKGTPDSWSDHYLSVIGISNGAIEDDNEWADIDTLYHLPTGRYPQGLYAIVCEGKVLYAGPYPYPFLGRLPFCVFREIPAPWRFYGEGSASHVLKAQEHYTMLRKMERRYLRNFANGKWLLPKGLQIRKNQLVSESDRFVPYRAKDPRHKPEFVGGQNPPNGLSNAMERAKEDGNRASGLNEASHGIAPTGITAGRALLALQEMDATRLGITIELNEKEYARWGQNTLLMAREFYIEERKYRIAGESMFGCVQSFNAADLGSAKDVICQPGSAMPQNRIAKQETAIEFFKLGVIGDPADPETMVKLRRILEFGQIEDIHDDDGLDEQKAEAENRTLSELGKQLQTQGVDMATIPPEQLMQMAAPASPLENHFVHMRNHVRTWKQKQIQGDIATAALIEAHLQTHFMILNPPQEPQPEEIQPGQDPNQPPPAPTPAPGPTGGEIAGRSEPVATEESIDRGDLQIAPADHEPALQNAMEI